MIVNVVQILPMETLREVQKPTPGCLLQRYVTFHPRSCDTDYAA